MLEDSNFIPQAKKTDDKPFTKCQFNIKDLLNEIETQVFSQHAASSNKNSEYRYTQFGFGNMREISESSQSDVHESGKAVRGNIELQ